MLSIPGLRVWHLSQQALSGMLAGLLHQPHPRRRSLEATMEARDDNPRRTLTRRRPMYRILTYATLAITGSGSGIVTSQMMSVSATINRRVHTDTDPKAELLLKTVREVYATCASYYDEGEVESVFVHTSLGNSVDIRPFVTAFVRKAGALRFDFRHKVGESKWNKYVVWCEGDGVKSWWALRPEVKYGHNLKDALVEARGVSNRSSTAIPSLLLKWSPDDFSELTKIRIVTTESLGEISCVKIEAVESGDGRKCILWIDQNTHLLRKYYSVFEIDPSKVLDPGDPSDNERANRPFTVRQTITWIPSINKDISASDLTFDPPRK